MRGIALGCLLYLFYLSCMAVIVVHSKSFDANASTLLSSAADRVEVAAAQCSTYIASGSLRAGQTLLVGAGWIHAPAGGFQIPSGVRIVGAWAGRNRVTGGTIVIPASATDPAFVLVPGPDEAGNVRLECLIVDGPGRVGFLLTTSTTPAHVELVRCMAQGCDTGLVVRATRTVDFVLVQECSLVRCKVGAYLERATWARVLDSFFAGNAGPGLVLETCDLAEVTRSYLEANDAPAQLELNNSMSVNVQSVNVEGFAPRVAIAINGGRYNRVGGCRFLSGASMAVPAGIGVKGTNTTAPVVDRCFSRCVLQTSSWTNCPGWYVAAQSVAAY